MGATFPWNALNSKYLNSNDYKKLNPKRATGVPYDRKEMRFPKTKYVLKFFKYSSQMKSNLFVEDIIHNLEGHLKNICFQTDSKL